MEQLLKAVNQGQDLPKKQYIINQHPNNLTLLRQNEQNLSNRNENIEDEDDSVSANYICEYIALYM